MKGNEFKFKCLREHEVDSLARRFKVLEGDMKQVKATSIKTCQEVEDVRKVLDDNGQPGLRTIAIRTQSEVHGLKETVESLTSTLKWVAAGIFIPLFLFAIDKFMVAVGGPSVIWVYLWYFRIYFLLPL